MNTNLSRRQLLKTGTLAATAAFVGLPAFRSHSSALSAEFIHMTDEEKAFYYFKGQERVRARLFANENPFGPSPKALEAMQSALKNSFRYPFDEREELIKKIAAYEGVGADHILLGSGSTQLLMAAGVAFGMNEGRIVASNPTFDSLPRFASGVKANLVKVEVDDQFRQDLNKMSEAITSGTSLVYLVNPLNPTGTQLPGSAMKDFCSAVHKNAPLFVDEAYIDYHPEGLKASMVSCIREGMDVIVCKTFSKVHGFAGVRVGYVVAKPGLLAKMRPFSTGGFDLALPAVMGAMASVDDKDFLKFSVEQNEASKQVLYTGLKKLGINYIPSFTNFAMFPINVPGSTLVSRLKEKGVLVRTWNFQNRHWCRVSIGLKEEMDIFNKALGEVV